MVLPVKEDGMKIASRESPAALRLLWALDAPRLIGKRIKQRREELQWSQQRLAEESGVSIRTIPRLESGSFGRLRRTTATALSTALGIPEDELRPPVEYSDEPEQLARIEAKLDELLSRLGGEGLSQAFEEAADRLDDQQEQSVSSPKRKPPKRKAS